MPSFTVPEYKCPTCSGVTWVYGKKDPEHPGYKAVPCPDCRQLSFEEIRRKAMYKFSGMPANANDLTFDKFTVKPENENAYQAVIDLIAGQLKFVTLIGHVDTGKTHLACASCHEHIKLNIPAKYAFVPRFLDELRATYDQDATYDFDTISKRYETVPLLVLDDLYRQKPTEWASEKIMSLVNSRYMAAMPTIFTTNKSFAEICEIDKDQGEAITSRLQREKWCRVCVL